LDTRFRELQRRGSDIAGDSTRRIEIGLDVKAVLFFGIRWKHPEGDFLRDLFLLRPMMEKDASQYLKDLEAFHAEQADLKHFSLLQNNHPQLDLLDRNAMWNKRSKLCKQHLPRPA